VANTNPFDAYFEPLVLEYSFDSCILIARGELRLEDDAKRSVAHDLALGVLNVFGFAGQPILDLLPYHFCVDISYWVTMVLIRNRPPIRSPEKPAGRLLDMASGWSGWTPTILRPLVSSKAGGARSTLFQRGSHLLRELRIARAKGRACKMKNILDH
jgi:hypothetical protein